MSATAQLWAVAGRGLVPVPPIQSVSGNPALQVGGECQDCSSDQSTPTPKGPRQDKEEVADDEEVPGECPHRKHKEGKALKEPRKEVISKGSDIIKAARCVYQKAHWANFEQEGSYDLSSIFCQMATSNNLLNAEVYKVQETCSSQRTSRLLTGWQGLFQKTSTFSRSSHPWSCQRSCTSRASIPWRPCDDEAA